MLPLLLGRSRGQTRSVAYTPIRARVPHGTSDFIPPKGPILSGPPSARAAAFLDPGSFRDQPNRFIPVGSSRSAGAASLGHVLGH